MKILVDIGHPAHVHFFRNAISILRDRGAEIIVTSRDKDCATPLLDEFGISHRQLSQQRKGSWALAKELVSRDLALYRLARQEKPDIMVAIGGIFISHVSALTGIPSIVFYDTENAKLQNALTYPLADVVVVPRAYQSWVPKKRHIRYPGYHELAYLHPDFFVPDYKIAVENGCNPDGDTFLIRVVSWQANHDIGERGWSVELLTKTVRHLMQQGKVILSAEGTLPPELEPLRYAGKVSALHHVLSFSQLLVGESATLCSEAAVLGVPSIYAAHTGRGYTDEQEERYHLVRNVKEFNFPAIQSVIDECLSTPNGDWKKRRSELLADTINVTQLTLDLVDDYKSMLADYQQMQSSV